MASRPDIIQFEESFDDSGAKNGWRWAWLQEKVGEEVLRTNIRKLTGTGSAYCEQCREEIKYGSKGKSALTKHVRAKSHIDRQPKKDNSETTQTALPGCPLAKDKTYGLHPLAVKKVLTETERPTDVPLLVPLLDRTANSEAMVIALAVENNMALAAVPKIVELAKALANDKEALNNMAVSRTAASHKLKFGVAETFRQELVSELNATMFSLNLDEAMNSNNEKIVSVLASHFSEAKQQVVINHLVSFSISQVTSNNIYQGLKKAFEVLGLKWSQLLSVMTDSCNVMHGQKAGLLALIREDVPHLLDVDGDTCHHAHNCAKLFTRPFGSHIESLLNDLHTDHKWSTHTRDQMFQKICLALGILPSSPQRFVSHRWLSLVQVLVDTVRLMDAAITYYFSFLDASDQSLYKDYVEEIYQRRNVELETKKRISKNIFFALNR